MDERLISDNGKRAHRCQTTADHGCCHMSILIFSFFVFFTLCQSESCTLILFMHYILTSGGFLHIRLHRSYIGHDRRLSCPFSKYDTIASANPHVVFKRVQKCALGWVLLLMINWLVLATLRWVSNKTERRLRCF
jgi:hypothetical protein